MRILVTAMEARMTAAESLAEELQMENDGKHTLTHKVFFC